MGGNSFSLRNYSEGLGGLIPLLKMCVNLTINSNETENKSLCDGTYWIFVMSWGSEYSLFLTDLVKINEDSRMGQIGFGSSRIYKSASNPYRLLAAVQVEVMTRCSLYILMWLSSFCFSAAARVRKSSPFVCNNLGQKYVKTRKNWWIQQLAQIF